jgi:hypothetical protein
MTEFEKPVTKAVARLKEKSRIVALKSLISNFSTGKEIEKKWMAGDVAIEGGEQIRVRTDLSLVSYQIAIASYLLL